MYFICKHIVTAHLRYNIFCSVYLDVIAANLRDFQCVIKVRKKRNFMMLWVIPTCCHIIYQTRIKRPRFNYNKSQICSILLYVLFSSKMTDTFRSIQTLIDIFDKHQSIIPLCDWNDSHPTLIWKHSPL